MKPLLLLLKLFLSPRFLAGMIPFVLVMWVAHGQDVALYWSIPAGIWYGSMVGFAYEFIVKNR